MTSAWEIEKPVMDFIYETAGKSKLSVDSLTESRFLNSQSKTESLAKSHAVYDTVLKRKNRGRKGHHDQVIVSSMTAFFLAQLFATVLVVGVVSLDLSIVIRGIQCLLGAILVGFTQVILRVWAHDLVHDWCGVRAARLACRWYLLVSISIIILGIALDGLIPLMATWLFLVIAQLVNSLLFVFIYYCLFQKPR